MNLEFKMGGGMIHFYQRQDGHLKIRMVQYGRTEEATQLLELGLVRRVDVARMVQGLLRWVFRWDIPTKQIPKRKRIEVCRECIQSPTLRCAYKGDPEPNMEPLDVQAVCYYCALSIYDTRGLYDNRGPVPHWRKNQI